ncbi:hypothetical protein L4C39_10130 [Vibrio clamense]|uniref:hypothetical protein n=1 Tax=Vibrio clamense TaxID=2910254 RepID=UPI003D258C24
MKKILLICPKFTPSNTVSVHRNKFFVEKLSVENKVDIWVSDRKTNYSDFFNEVTVLPEGLVDSFKNVFKNGHGIKNYVYKHGSKYDQVIISCPEFTLLSFAIPFRKLGAKVILDIRDLPDMIYFNYKKQGVSLLFLRYLFLKVVESYIKFISKTSDLVICVGLESERILNDWGINAVSVHNGFLESDVTNHRPETKVISHRKIIKIGCGGNVYDFRDSEALRNLIDVLDSESSYMFELHHYGKLSSKLLGFVSKKKYLKYYSYSQVDREIYLKALVNYDLSLLVTSDCLIWEPTTTVFDYILLNSKILFVGSAKEAKNILISSKTDFIDCNDIDIPQLIEFVERKAIVRNEIDLYSREFQYEKFKKYYERLCN